MYFVLRSKEVFQAQLALFNLVQRITQPTCFLDVFKKPLCLLASFFTRTRSISTISKVDVRDSTAEEIFLTWFTNLPASVFPVQVRRFHHVWQLRSLWQAVAIKLPRSLRLELSRAIILVLTSNRLAGHLSFPEPSELRDSRPDICDSN